ncbi:LCP family protein (plasmid) [Phyllobacterium sp. 628]|uniref:LCP family protein n=1 Tax=Phyllobacterium sp. 628 TaxID=2718938 RepID=UPI001662581E|nr:LCP family protein [Phyllobacterium sp. 628]QND54746.1 LCP family protein [Phyllobacterium sp. 628]
MSSGLIEEPPASENTRHVLRRHWVLWLLVILIAMVLVVAAGAYMRLVSNVRHVEITRNDLSPARPAKTPSSALNILVVGTDQRDGEEAGERTDTIMLVHVSPEQNNATVISFPRDLMVQLPACRSREGLPGQRGHRGMINSSYTFGGIWCAWNTIETLTAIRIDHFIKVDFNGFRAMVDAVGGVELCIPEPINDKYVQLNLPAGLQTLQGDQALGYVRARHSLGDGTDIGRIQRQQIFVAAMAKKSLQGGPLVAPFRLFALMDAATKSITTDSSFTPAAMIKLALFARGLSPDNIDFIVTPWRYSTAYPGRVEWLESPAKKLFRLIAADEPLSRSATLEPQLATAREITEESGNTAIPARASPISQPSIAPVPSAPCTID